MAAIRWILFRLLTQPIVWVWITITAFLWPAVTGFAPVHDSTGDALETSALYEVAFLSLLLGAALTVNVIGRFEELFRRSPTLRRVSVQGVALATGSTVFGVAGVALPLVGFVLEGHVAPFSGLALGATLVVGHLAAMGVLLLQVRMPGGIRPLLLPLLVWLMPALTGDTSNPAAWFARGFDASRHLACVNAHPSPTAFLQASAPIIGMILLSLLVASHPRRGS